MNAENAAPNNDQDTNETQHEGPPDRTLANPCRRPADPKIIHPPHERATYPETSEDIFDVVCGGPPDSGGVLYVGLAGNAFKEVKYVFKY